MKYYAFSDTKWNRLLYALFLLALLLLSRDSMYGLTVFGFYPSQAAMLVILAVFGLAFLIVQRKHLKEIFTDPRLPALGIFALLFLLPMILKRDWQLMYLSILLYIAIAVFVSYFTTLARTSRAYLAVLSVLSVYAMLATYVIRILPDQGLITMPVFENDAGFHFYQMGLSVVSIDFVTMRNFGIFREPGVYQFFVLLGLVLNNYTAQWEKPWQLWTVNIILGLTMLSTFATGGIIEMGLLVIFLFWDKKWYRLKKARILAYAALLALAGAVVWVLVTKNVLYEELIGIFGKFDGENETGSSRIGSILTDLDIFLHHPILGDSIYNVLHAQVDNTSSTMIQYAAFGAVTASLHVLAWGALVWDKNRHVLGNLFLMLVLFMGFNTQNFNGNPIFWLFPILALVERGLPWVLARKGKAHGN